MTKEAINQRFINAVDLIIDNGYAKNKKDIATKLQLSPNKLTEILNGRNNVGVDVIVHFCNLYGVSFDWLLNNKGEVFTNHIDVFSDNALIVSEPGFVYQTMSLSDAEPLYDDQETEEFTNKNGNKFYVYPDGTIKIEVPKLTEPAYAGYVETFNDQSDLQELNKTTFTVDRIGKGNYMAFTIKNNSMWNGGGYDTPGGAEILGREIGRHLWTGGFHKTDYGFILLTKKAIYHKDIKSYDENTGILTLSSRNPDVEDFEISINDVYKVFNVIKRAF